jgi:hypothetical protein
MPRTKEQDEWHRRGFNAGMAVAAGICVSAHGEEVVAEEILGAAGLNTHAKAKAAGVDNYDLRILRPVFAHMKP